MVLFSVACRMFERGCSDGLDGFACTGARHLSGAYAGYFTNSDDFTNSEDPTNFDGFTGFDDFSGNARWPAGTNCPVP